MSSPSSFMKLESVSMTPENPQDGRSVCCCFNYRIDTTAALYGVLRLAHNQMRNVRRMSPERECQQDGGHGKKD